MKIYRDENLSNFEFWSGAISYSNPQIANKFLEVPYGIRLQRNSKKRRY